MEQTWLGKGVYPQEENAFLDVDGDELYRFIWWYVKPVWDMTWAKGKSWAHYNNGKVYICKQRCELVDAHVERGLHIRLASGVCCE